MSFNNTKHVLPAVLFIAIVLLDMFQGQWEFYNASKELQWIKLLKLCILVFIGANAIKSYRILFYITASLIISVAIGYNKSFLQIEVLQHLVKYLSPFIYYYGFKALLNSDEKRKVCIKASLYLIYFGLIAILIGMVFKIESFQTYTHRFGYKGLFKRSIDVSYFLIFSILFISLFRAYVRRPVVLVAMIFVCSIIAGTKLPWLFLALYLSYLFVRSKQLRKPILLYSIPIGLIGVSLVYFIIPDKIKGTFDLFYTIYQEKGFFSSLTSFRSDLLLEAIEYYKNHWQWKNIFFGGQDFDSVLVEMSLPDLVIFFGIIGAILYSIFYYSVYFNNRDKNFQFLYATVIIASIFAGQFFFNPSVTIWFAVIAVLANNKKSKIKNNNMRIFLISNMYPTKEDPSYGIFVRNVVVALKNLGVDFSSIIVIKGKTKGYLKKAYRYLIYYLKIAKHYLKGDYDIIYIHFLSHNSPVLYVVKRLFNKREKWIVNVHGSDIVDSNGRWIDKYNEKVLEYTDLIVVPSIYFKRMMLNQYPSLKEEKYYISPSGGVDPKLFYPLPKKPTTTKAPIFGFVSRIDKGKGWDIFLEALYILQQKEINFEAIIIGSGAQESELIKKIIDLELSENVRYLGVIEQKKLVYEYQAFDLFVFPTTRKAESLGLVGLEAMSCGVPVIGSRIAGLETYLIDNENGFFFTPGDANDLANKILNYLSFTVEERNDMQKSAYETAKNYHKEKVLVDLHARFQQVLD